MLQTSVSAVAHNLVDSSTCPFEMLALMHSEINPSAMLNRYRAQCTKAGKV
jgi:hypothetical protein